MTMPGVVELEVPGQPGSKFGWGFVGAQVHIFVLHTAPQPFDKHFVQPSALANYNWSTEEVISNTRLSNEVACSDLA